MGLLLNNLGKAYSDIQFLFENVPFFFHILSTEITALYFFLWSAS